MVCAMFFHIAILYTFTRVCYMDIANYYIYMEACEDRFCYAVKEINISYNTKSQAVSLLCTTPTPLDEEEILPRATVKGTNAYETNRPNILAYTADQSCNDTTPLLLEFISGESHFIAVSIFYHDFGNNSDVTFTHEETKLSKMLINFQPNGSVTVTTLKFGEAPQKTDLTFNETSSKCSIYEDDGKRACFCKENHAVEYCLHRDYRELDPSRTGFEYYHIYGRLSAENLHYYYYFEVSLDKTFSYIMYVLRYSANALQEVGGNESMSLCVSFNGSASEAKYNSQKICLGALILIPSTRQSNFTAFAKFHDGEWHSLLWFDYLRWSKIYFPGNCSYEEQIFDGIVHPFAICMRRNITEKLYKNITRGAQTNSTLRISTDNDYNDYVKETSQATVPTLISTLPGQADIEAVTDDALQRFFNPYVSTSFAPREITEIQNSIISPTFSY